MATTPDYPIIGPPRISLAGFGTVLREAGSPAAGEYVAEYGAFVGIGIDPAVGLAIFRKESTYGKFGRARNNRSWGNIRGGITYPRDDKGFRIYPSWTIGATDAARLLRIYGTNSIRPGTKTSTVQTFPFVWAPSSDGNAPDAYGDSLARWIGEWSKKYPASGSSNPPINADPASTGSAGAPPPAWINDDSRVLSDDDLRELRTWILANSPAANQAALEAYLTALFWPSPIASPGAPNFKGKTLGELKAYAPGLFKPISAGAGGLGPGLGEVLAGIPAALGEVFRNGLLFLAVLALIVVGLYLVATSER